MTTPHMNSLFVPRDGSDQLSSQLLPPVPARVAERFMAKAMSLLKISSPSSSAEEEEDDDDGADTGAGGGLDTTQWMKLPSTTLKSVNWTGPSSSLPAAISRTRFSTGMLSCRLTAAFKSSTVAVTLTVTSTSPMSDDLTLTVKVSLVILQVLGVELSKGTTASLSPPPVSMSSFFPISKGCMSERVAADDRRHHNKKPKVWEEGAASFY